MSRTDSFDFINFLSARLQEELPGEKIQRVMAPLRPDEAQRGFITPPGARQSAVLVPLIAKENSPVEILFTLRSGNLRSHKGQISFPGGRCDEGEDFVETALREAREEIGIPEEKISVLGKLSGLYVYPSNSAITPVVGWMRAEEKFFPNEHEVEEIFSLPLERFLREEYLRRETWNLMGKEVEVPFWNVHRTPLWGATAIMLNELLHLYKEFLSQ